MNKNPVITIDGPCGVGKSTVSQIIAKNLNWPLLESGNIYRFIAFLALNTNIEIVEKNMLILLNNLNCLSIKKKILIIFIE